VNYGSEGKALYVQKIFNAIANKYDIVNTVMSLGMDGGWRRLAVKQLNVQPGMHILDMCCGTGRLTSALSRAVGEEGAVTGLDFSENMISIAEQTVGKTATNVQFVRGDATNLPFPDNSFDGATVGWGLRNLSDLRQGIREMVRVVKPGGRVVSLDMAKPSLPVYREVYWLYFEILVPFLGKVIARQRDAYRHLYESSREFPPQAELAGIFADCGLEETAFKNLAGGVVAIVSGTKP